MVRGATDADYRVPDDVRRAVEDDDELTHLSRAVYQLEHAGMCGPESDPDELLDEALELAVMLGERRVEQLLEQAEEEAEG
jgi:hypothetical protein